jgi:L-iditol 2-dehydrogenase
MRVARLHGVRDLRVEQLPVPEPGAGELLIEVEACGVCPTDVRKYRIGTGDGYPLNPGHEWVGRVAAVGSGAGSWRVGQRVYGDTYAGYAEFALLAVEPGPWSAGPVEVPDALPAEVAVFVEPLADCLHAVGRRAMVDPGQRVAVVGAGQMGVQLVGAAALAGAHVIAIEPLAERQELARAFGAAEAGEAWPDELDAVILSVPLPELVDPAMAAVRPGGRVVLFAGFGDRGRAEVDLNQLHYREVVLTGSEWIGTPPNARPELYQEARDLLAAGRLPVERLVTGTCDLDGLHAAFDAVQARRGMKTVLVP